MCPKIKVFIHKPFNMQQFKTISLIGLLSSAIFFVACNQPKTNPESGDNSKDTLVKETAVKPEPEMPAYDPAMEPTKVGAQFSQVLHDTLGIKMYLFTLKPGDSAALHSHPDHTVYVLQGGTALISMNDGAPQQMELKEGMGFISPALKDYGKNIGKTTIRLVITDIYRPRAK